MRDILFRGKQKSDGEWVYGNLLSFASHKDKAWIFSCEISFRNQTIDTEINEIDCETIGEYTGLCDKNDEEIFECDILKYGDYLFIVEFGACGGTQNVLHDVGYKGFYAKPISTKVDGPFGLRNDIVYWVEEGAVVVGNIHDNPELLEGE